MAAEPYDSRPETQKHIEQVRGFLRRVIASLQRRLREHDASKLLPPEVEAFDEFTPKLAASTYGSEEYERMRESIKPALAHHYAHNRHHPEHFPDGTAGMNLADVVEMLCDWAAAVKRHDNGCIVCSVTINQRRFGFSDELRSTLLNTIVDFDLGNIDGCDKCAGSGARSYLSTLRGRVPEQAGKAEVL